MKIFKKSKQNPIKSGLIRINPPELDFLQIIRIFCNPGQNSHKISPEAGKKNSPAAGKIRAKDFACSMKNTQKISPAAGNIVKKNRLQWAK